MGIYNFYAPTEVLLGKGAESETGRMVRKYGGTRVLLHYGSGSVIKSGLLNRIKQSLEEEGISYVELGGVVPNPHLSKVYEGIELCKKEGVDFLLAVGGGSTIDSSKAIGYGLAEPDKDVWELYDKKRKAAGCLPVGVVLTIAAAGSEMSDSSVITNTETGEKRGYSSNYARAKFALMNPDLTKTLPDYQTQAGCTDIIMHTIERYFVQGNCMELTDQIAEGLVRTVMQNALILHQDPENEKARAEVMWASSLSHNGLTGIGHDTKDFSSHRLEHEMGGMFDVTHGAGLAAVWGSWARYVYKECLPRFVRFAEKVMDIKRTDGMDDEQFALAGIQAIEQFFHQIGMPVNMKELGIEPTEEQLHEMAAGCSRASGGKLGSAKVLVEEDMYNIYKMAL
ncbi:MAG: iron-containing alcohol dehydrogenase [Lachnospiraceae bacterium]|nr:iron-containing alcohol dehydrogenase [Lachnospiraceae bacterium]